LKVRKASTLLDLLCIIKRMILKVERYNLLPRLKDAQHSGFRRHKHDI